MLEDDGLDYIRAVGNLSNLKQIAKHTADRTRSIVASDCSESASRSATVPSRIAHTPQPHIPVRSSAVAVGSVAWHQASDHVPRIQRAGSRAG